MNRKILSIILISLLFVCLFSFKERMANAQENSCEIVMEVSTKRVLFAKNIDTKMKMASLTKVLTAIIVIEEGNLDSVERVPDDSIGIEGSSIYLAFGEHLSRRELLYGLMLRSGNDCAVALALLSCETVEQFAQKMNDKAEELGCENSSFTNPHGLDDLEHFTTAFDFALICSYAMQNETFKEIVSTKKIEISNEFQNYNRALYNKNKMLSNFEGACGIKTGYTKKSGRCLASSCERNGMLLVSVVLNCYDMWNESERILNETFSSYNMVEVVPKDSILKEVQIEDYTEKALLYCKENITLPLTQEESDTVEIVYNIYKSVQKPIKCDSEVGNIEIYVAKQLLFSQKIYTINNIE